MPKLICPNGHVLDLSSIPTPGESFYEETHRWHEVVDRLVDAVSRLATHDRTLLAEAVSDALAGAVRYFYRCETCGALSFPSEEPPAGYLEQRPITPASRPGGS
jgi:hypothetical protein